MAITINGDVTGSVYNAALQTFLNNIDRHYSSDTAPMVGTDSPLEVGRIWHDTANNLLRVRNKANDDWVALPFNTETGAIDAGAGAGVTGLTTSNFANPDFDLTGAQEDNTTIASANAVKVYVDALDTSTTTDRALIRTEFAAVDTALDNRLDTIEGTGTGSITSAVVAEALLRTNAETAHYTDTSTHGVGVIVGTTETQGLSNKAITAGTNSATTIDGVIIGGTTRAAGSFTQLEIGSTVTDVGGTITGGASSITINPDPTSTTGTVVIAGDLTVNGTTTTINSTTQSHADKDIILAAGATTNAGVTGAGLLLGSPATLESWLYNGTNWVASAPLRAEAYDVGTTNIIDTSGNWVNRANSIPVGSLTGSVATGNLPVATTGAQGIAQFSSDNFDVTAGTVTIKDNGVALGTETTGNYVSGVAQATTNNGLNVSHTASEGSTATLSNSLATDSAIGTASFSSADFSVSSGAVSIKTDGVAPATQIAGGTLASDVKVNTDNFDTTGSKQLDVNKGGTGKVTVTAGVLLRGDNANDLVETTIGTGLDINTNSLDVDLSELDIQSFGQVPSFASNGGRVVVVNTAENALEYSTSVVENSAIESWARTSGGAGTTALTNRVLTHSGTDAATGYAWVDANDSDALNVGLGATEAINVASVSTTGNISAAGNLSVSGNTTLGDAATDTIAINGLVSSGITPDGPNTRDFGSNTARWKSVHTNNLSLGGQSVTEIDTDISGTAPTVNTSVPSVQAVRTYIDNIEAGGSIVILAQPGTKNVPAGGIAIVTISGLTKMFTAVTSQTGVNKGTDFDGSGSGTNFEATANWTEFTAVGGTQVTINKFTGDGTEINFTLSLDPGSEDNVNVFIDGVYQLKDAYTVSGTTLSFGTGNPVPNGSKVEVLIGTTVNFASGSIGDVTATGTIIAPNIGNASTSYLGDGSNLSNLPAGYSGWTVSDGTNTSVTSSGETLTLTAGGGTAITVSDNALSISSPSLGTGATQAATGNHNHEDTYTEPKTGSTSAEGFFVDTDGAGVSKNVRFRYRNGSGTLITLASISVSDILSGVTIDDLG